MLEYVLMRTILWSTLILSSLALAALIFWKVRKDRKKKANKAKLLPVIAKAVDFNDWHAGKHFGEIFYHPQFRSFCVVLKVASREEWYFATQKEPEVMRRSRIPITMMVGGQHEPNKARRTARERP